MKVKSIKGMEDLYDLQSLQVWRLIENKAAGVFGSAGFQEIRTPIVESADLFERSVGESTDIVSKEMYTLLDRNGQRLALRPEGTASVVRAFIEHFTSHQILEGRFYYCGPMFRYERPQKGRYRQFHQIGAEWFGVDHPLADAEMIFLVDRLLRDLKLPGLLLRLNSLGSRECRQRYREELQKFLQGIESRFSEEFRERVKKNPLRCLDSKDPEVIEALEQAPSIQDSLSAESREHFSQVCRALENRGVPFRVDPRMVRGLDYYEKTVFEFSGSGLGAQNAIAGGGRYNDLVEDLGGPSVPAVGFALGMERVVDILPREQHGFDSDFKIYLVPLDEESEFLLFDRLAQLHSREWVVQMDLAGGSLKAKMRRASRWGADCAVLCGQQERERGIVILKNMRTGHQEEVPIELLLSKLVEKLPTKHFSLY